MIKTIIKRLLQAIPALLVISFVVFMMLHLIPGDPVMNILGLKATPEAIASLRQKLGLDLPLYQQYFRFITNIFKGDLGSSIVTKVPIIDELSKRYYYTFIIAVGGTVVAAVFGVLVGIISAVKQNSFWDNFLMVLSLVSVSTPSFFLALILVLVFSLHFGWFPSVGIRTPLHYVLPILTVGMQSIGFVARMTRSSMLNVLRQDYIRTARSKGVAERFIIAKHAFKNALVTVITVIGLRFGGLLAGSALVEIVFSIPGIGSYMVNGVLQRDYPVVQVTVLLIACTFVLVNLIVDILYVLVDPRIKY